MIYLEQIFLKFYIDVVGKEYLCQNGRKTWKCTLTLLPFFLQSPDILYLKDVNMREDDFPAMSALVQKLMGCLHQLEQVCVLSFLAISVKFWIKQLRKL